MDPNSSLNMEDPGKSQIITPMEAQLQLFAKMEEIDKEIMKMRESIRTLSATMSTHAKQNIETFERLNEYIGDQISYRLLRERMEENDIELELKKKDLQLKNLLEEQKMDDEENQRLQLAYKTQQLEIEHLQKSLAIIQDIKQSTKDKLKAITPEASSLSKKVKETFILTGIGTLTAAAVGGVIAFIVFFVRFYIQNNP